MDNLLSARWLDAGVAKLHDLWLAHIAQLHGLRPTRVVRWLPAIVAKLGGFGLKHMLYCHFMFSQETVMLTDGPVAVAVSAITTAISSSEIYTGKTPINGQ